MKSPPKEERRLCGTALKTRELPTAYCNDERAQCCKHANTYLERMAAGPHYARKLCHDCGVFIKWVPKPETLEKKRLHGFRLAKLAMCAQLNAWERHFVSNMSRQRKFSPRQQAQIDQLVATYLGETMP
jgi:hypothetical protein